MEFFNGNLEFVRAGVLHGWALLENNEKINQPVYVFANGVSLGEIKEFYFRKDLMDAGIADGKVAFNFSLLPYLNTLNDEVEFSLATSLKAKKTFLNKKIKIPNSKLLNKHHQPRLINSNTLVGWDINIPHRVGLRLEQYHSKHSIVGNFSYYVRFGLLDYFDSGEELTILVPINTDEPISLMQLCCQFIVRSDRHSTVLFELFKNDDLIFSEPVNISSSWQKGNIVLSDQEFNMYPGEGCYLKITLKHSGKGFFDIAFVGVSEDTEVFQKLANDQDTRLPINFVPAIENGNLDRWGNGFSFSPLKRGIELADNWFFECNKENEKNIFINVETYLLNPDPLVLQDSRKSLRVRSKKLTGYARLIIPIDNRVFNLEKITLKLIVNATGLGRVSTIPRICLIGRNTKSDQVIYDIARKVDVKNKVEKCFEINERDIFNIRKNLKDLPSIVIAIELDSNTDLSFCQINIEPEELITNDKLIPLLKNNQCFEDESISKQLSILKGLNTWSKINSDNSQTGPRLTGESKNKQVESVWTEIFNLKSAKFIEQSTYPALDIIIPVFNANEDVLRCICSVITKTTLPYKLWIIDDGSEDLTAKMLDIFNSIYPHIELIRNIVNKGYTKSVNIGLKVSNNKWKVILNSDTIVTANWVQSLFDCAFSKEKVGMIGPLSNAASWQSVPEIFSEDGDWNLNPIPSHLTIDDIAELVNQKSDVSYPEVGVINGFCQLVSNKMLDEIGYLDEDAFPTGFGEENDMCARAVKAGYKLLIADNTYIYHAKSKSFGHETRKKLSKQGNQALKTKHPDVDWKKVTDKIKNNKNLNNLRSNLLHAIKER